MKKHFYLRLFMAVAVLETLFLLSGCASGNTLENQVAPDVENRTAVAYGRASCMNADYPKKFAVAWAGDCMQPAFAGELEQYSINGLAALGMSSVPPSEPEKILIRLHFHTDQAGDQPRFFYRMTAEWSGQTVWSVETYCFGPAEEVRNYLPGLVAGAMPLVGANRESAALNLKQYRYYLEAVLKNAQESETAEQKSSQFDRTNNESLQK